MIVDKQAGNYGNGPYQEFIVEYWDGNRTANHSIPVYRLPHSAFAEKDMTKYYNGRKEQSTIGTGEEEQAMKLQLHALLQIIVQF